MIDLSFTKEQMAAEINSSGKERAAWLTDPSAPDFVSLDEACLIVKGNTPGDILPVLNSAYSKRFAGVPSDQLFRDLTYPLKKGVGNAYKWGNKKDPSKKIIVESLVTKTGALVAISDEGNGFDVGGVLRKFQNDERYFSYGGSGFVHFQKAKSLISYSDGGRTLLIRFVCGGGLGRPINGENGSILGEAGDEEFMTSFLAKNVSYFRKNRVALEACRIYVPDKPQKGEVEVRYLLECRIGRTTTPVTFLGRVLPEGACHRDFSVSRQLYMGPFRKERSLHIPKPVAAFQHPSLVCFKFNPSMDLRGYLKEITDFQEVAKVIKSVAVGLRTLHQSRIAVEVERRWEDELEQYHAVRERVVARLAATSPQRVDRVREIFHRFLQRGASLPGHGKVPIHGAFSWDCILYDDKRFYLFRFDQCRRSHPGFDVGGFLSDLHRFYFLRKKGDWEAYHAARKVFLDAYSAGQSPEWYEDLPFFVVSGMLKSLDRLLQRPENKWMEKIDPLLDQCENMLQEKA